MADTGGKYSLEQIFHKIYALNTEGMGENPRKNSLQKIIIKPGQNGICKWSSSEKTGKPNA
jgi:hypothetical protein